MRCQLKYLLGSESTRPVFVVGTGRSGTHWLGYSLENHPEVRATIETKPMFELATKMALNPALEKSLYAKLVRSYNWQLLKSPTPIYVDKTHPNIWLAEKLKESFPSAQFVGLIRNPYATVASMLKHQSVSKWHKRWKEFPVPNRFLGITVDMKDHYGSYPIAAQCALRWRAHFNQMNDLRHRLGTDLLVISYEEFSQNTAAVIQNLQEFLGLEQPLPLPVVKTESLDKWRTQLSIEDISHIQEVVGFSTEEVDRYQLLR